MKLIHTNSASNYLQANACQPLAKDLTLLQALLYYGGIKSVFQAIACQVAVLVLPIYSRVRGLKMIIQTNVCRLVYQPMTAHKPFMSAYVINAYIIITYRIRNIIFIYTSINKNIIFIIQKYWISKKHWLNFVYSSIYFINCSYYFII